MGRLTGLDPERHIPDAPRTWYKGGQKVCAAKTKSGRQCLRAAQLGGLYCAGHGEYN